MSQPGRLPGLSSSILALVGLGCLAEVVWVVGVLVPFPLFRYYRSDTDMGTITGHSHAGFTSFMVSFSILFLILGCGWLVSHRLSDRAGLVVIAGFGIMFAVTLAFVYPITAIDVFTYVAQSRVLVVYHQNPILVAPSAHPHDAVLGLAGGWARTTAPYGPVGLLVDAWPTRFGAKLLTNLVLLKLTFSLMAVLAGLLMFPLAKTLKVKSPLGATLLVVWNPLILFETSANGHNDGLVLVLVAAGLLLVIREEALLGTSLLLLSVLVKYTTLPLLPLALVYSLSRRPGWRSRLALALQILVLLALELLILYAPFWAGGNTFGRALEENRQHLQSFGSAASFLFPGIGVTTATTLGRVLFLPVYGYALWLSSKDSRNFLAGCFVTMVGFFGLAAANVKIWYAAVPAALSSVSGTFGRLSGFLLAYGATISAALFAYPLIWMGLTVDAFNLTNTLAYAATFLPAGILAGLNEYYRRKTAASVESLMGSSA